MTTETITQLSHKDLLSIASLSAAEIQAIFKTAARLKAERGRHEQPLSGKRLAMIFEKDSLRTRFTFDVGIQELGGSAVFLDHRDARLGSRESIRDMARNLERWMHLIVLRTFRHRAVVEMAKNCEIPVINGLTDFLHPCQGLTDLFTLTEQWGDLHGKRLCYVGDGNNTCHSLIHACAKLGMDITVCSPEGYEPNSRVVNESMKVARESGSEISITNDPVAATLGADALYTDVWASMGQEDEIEERAAIFADYQVDEEMLERAAPGALFMHCLPAHRGAEVTAAVMDGPASIVFEIAENRLHVQKAIMMLLVTANQGTRS